MEKQIGLIGSLLNTYFLFFFLFAVHPPPAFHWLFRVHFGNHIWFYPRFNSIMVFFSIFKFIISPSLYSCRIFCFSPAASSPDMRSPVLCTKNQLLVHGAPCRSYQAAYLQPAVTDCLSDIFAQTASGVLSIRSIQWSCAKCLFLCCNYWVVFPATSSISLSHMFCSGSRPCWCFLLLVIISFLLPVVLSAGHHLELQKNQEDS